MSKTDIWTKAINSVIEYMGLNDSEQPPAESWWHKKLAD